MIRFLSLLIVALPMIAQQPGRVDVFGLIGGGAVYDDEGSLGRGLTGGGGIGYRLRRRLGVEAEINAFRTERDFGQIVPPFQHSGFHLMGNALSHFGPARAQFYVLGGAGLLSVRNRVSDRLGAGFNVGFGVGMKIFATERVYVRPDFRIFGGRSGDGAEYPFSMLRLGIGVGYLW